MTRSDAGLESLAYHSDSGTYRVEYDREETAASMAVIGALSEVTGTDPTELEPLYTSVDPDALDELVDSRTASTGAVSVSLTVEGYEVTVDTRGVILVDVQDPTGEDPSVRGPVI